MCSDRRRCETAWAPVRLEGEAEGLTSVALVETGLLERGGLAGRLTGLEESGVGAAVALGVVRLRMAWKTDKSKVGADGGA